MRATWLPRTLRAGGVPVVELAGWQGRGSDFHVTSLAVTWHHDASPPGPSPGVPAYMARQIDKGEAGAQLWVGRDGTWTVVAAGAVYHAGNVLVGMPGNSGSLGVETDHTTGEGWPPAQLASLRRGTRALLEHQGLGASHLHFHKSVCRPKGRKIDPDGLELGVERAAVAGSQLDPPPAPAPPRHRAPPPPAGAAPPFPLPAGWYFGPRSGPRQCVSGYHGRGEHLVTWQVQMRARGWTITADGRYGPRTAEVARRFQAEKHLAVDALIGPATWAAAWTARVT